MSRVLFRVIDVDELGPLPPNVQLERFVPQSAILPRCSAVVCHGGSGTVIGALAHGLPLVTIPMGADQPLNAARCEALGVGLAALPGPEHAVALLARLVRE